MIAKPDWIKAEVKPYMHQISIDCLKKLLKFMLRFNKEKIDADTLFRIQKQILIEKGSEQILN